ncbi:uncharacterized protein LOC132700970 [Cylas formicarius]|uniref:uncharacterized protein LOC132700970 n=1 Tax=Cylas formicarius TaxID=197179 RepID=UPI0029585801|nr:uncharacterized protein LOC132700970 [Cylas formicarius]XP_060524557.1 uncharacterized protein LOC132700970 [Cylas formicarius]XP_060524558.1 uncharacterized protein LOC132700970 [Cylas formicarius]
MFSIHTIDENLQTHGVNGLAPNRAKPSRNVPYKPDMIYRSLLLFTRCWGIVAATVLAGVGIDLVYHRRRMGFYLIAESIFIFISEVSWVATLFLQLSVRSDHKIWRIWTTASCFQGWKKTLVYFPMAILSLILPYKLWLTYLSGAFLLLLSVLHSVLYFRIRRKRRRKQSRFYQNDADSLDSSRVEEITDVLDDGIPEPMPGSSVSLSDTLRIEHENFLEI